MIIYENFSSLLAHSSFVRKTPGTTKAQVGQIFALVKIYEIIFFKLSKMRILWKCWKKPDFSILNHVVASGVFRTNVVNL